MPKDAPTAIDASPATTSQDKQISRQDLPRITVSTSEEYIERAASVLSHAMLSNELWSHFFLREGIDGTSIDASREKVLQVYHSLVKQFLIPGAQSGAFVAEAGDFSTCASWWPPGSHQPPQALEHFDELERQGKTLRAAFGREIEKTKIELIWSSYGQEYWDLVVIARDPRKPALLGAVTAVLQPFIDQAATEGKPIWLVTSNEHARDIYQHFGWQVVKTVTFQGYNQWCMILYPPPQGTPC